MTDYAELAQAIADERPLVRECFPVLRGDAPAPTVPTRHSILRSLAYSRASMNARLAIEALRPYSYHHDVTTRYV